MCSCGSTLISSHKHTSPTNTEERGEGKDVIAKFASLWSLNLSSGNERQTKKGKQCDDNEYVSPCLRNAAQFFSSGTKPKMAMADMVRMAVDKGMTNCCCCLIADHGREQTMRKVGREDAAE